MEEDGSNVLDEKNRAPGDLRAQVFDRDGAVVTEARCAERGAGGRGD